MRASIVLCFLTLCFGVGTTHGAEKKKIAVLDFSPVEVTEEVSMKAAQVFRDKLRELNIEVPSREEVDKVFDEVDVTFKIKISQMECQNESCAMKAGRKLNTDKVIFGRIIKDEKQKAVVVFGRFLDVNTRDIEFVASVEGPLDADPSRLAAELARKIVSWMPKQGETKDQAKSRRLKDMKREEDETHRKRQEALKKLTHREKGACPEGMVLIAAGKFSYGSDSGDPNRGNNEENLKEVVVKEFCIDQYEFPNKKKALPKKKIEWFGGKEECANQGKRLCTEIEWEKACKGRKGLTYPYGNEFNADKCNTSGKIARSGKFGDCVSVSDHGGKIYDMSGSLREWTGSTYAPGGFSYVLRGGSYSGGAKEARCSTREKETPFVRTKNMGFRCCK